MPYVEERTKSALWLLRIKLTHQAMYQNRVKHSNSLKQRHRRSQKGREWWSKLAISNRVHLIRKQILHFKPAFSKRHQQHQTPWQFVFPCKVHLKLHSRTSRPLLDEITRHHQNRSIYILGRHHQVQRRKCCFLGERRHP